MRSAQLMLAAATALAAGAACGAGAQLTAATASPASSASRAAGLSPAPTRPTPPSLAAGSPNALSPPSTETPGASVTTDLTLSGGLTGRARSGQLVGQCGPAGAGFSVGLRLTMGGRPYVLNVDVIDYHGPGRYAIPPERVSLRAGAPGAAGSLLPALGGQVQVDPGEASGALDASLGSGGGIRLQGAWSCR